MFPTLYFKSSLSTISIKNVNAMPFWHFCTSDFQVAILKMIIRTRSTEGLEFSRPGHLAVKIASDFNPSVDRDKNLIIYRNDNVTRSVKVNK